jgi:hypothetical protein
MHPVFLLISLFLSTSLLFSLLVLYFSCFSRNLRFPFYSTETLPVSLLLHLLFAYSPGSSLIPSCSCFYSLVHSGSSLFHFYSSCFSMNLHESFYFYMFLSTSLQNSLSFSMSGLFLSTFFCSTLILPVSQYFGLFFFY